MKQTFLAFLTVVAISALAGAASKSIQVKDLPAAVQKMVQDTLKGAEVKNISKEVEKGVTQYEVETLLNGKHRDFNVDGKLRSVSSILRPLPDRFQFRETTVTVPARSR